MKTHIGRKGILQQRGQSNVGCLLSVLALIVIGYGAYKVVPPLLGNFQLRTAAAQISEYSVAGVLSETKYASGQRRGSVEEIQEAVLMAARDLSIPILKEDVTVQAGADAVFITVRYSVPIYVLGRIYTWDFRFVAHN